MMNVDVVAIVAVLSGTIFAGFFVYIVYRFVALFVNKNKQSGVPDDVKNRLSELEHSQLRIEKRIQNLETIFVDNDLETTSKSIGKSSSEKSDAGTLKNKLRNK